MGNSLSPWFCKLTGTEACSHLAKIRELQGRGLGGIMAIKSPSAQAFFPNAGFHDLPALQTQNMSTIKPTPHQEWLSQEGISVQLSFKKILVHEIPFQSMVLIAHHQTPVGFTAEKIDLVAFFFYLVLAYFSHHVCGFNWNTCLISDHENLAVRHMGKTLMHRDPKEVIGQGS